MHQEKEVEITRMTTKEKNVQKKIKTEEKNKETKGENVIEK